MTPEPKPNDSTASWTGSDSKQAPPPLRDDPAARYRTLREHAKGGLGVVFLALDEELHREVALKQIQTPHADDPDARRRFVLEAEITGGLEHPGIVPVYGLGKDADGRPIYAMRFIRGDSFRDAIAELYDPKKKAASPREQLFRLRRLLSRFVGVCNAVAYAHSRGVVHRDLKPENIMLGPYGETLVVDWGLARTTSAPTEGNIKEAPLRPASADAESATRQGTVMGTPAYMSPEQAAGNPDVGPVSDVYSLGATLFCLLAGRAPFTKDEPDILQRVRDGAVPSLAKLNPVAPAPLIAICKKAMALKPEDRYATPTELADDVERWLADEPVSVYRDPVLARLGRWSRRHLVAVTLVGAFSLLLLSLLPPLLVLFGSPLARASLGGMGQKLEEADNRAKASENMNDLAKGPIDHHDAHAAKPITIRIEVLHESQKPEAVVEAMTELLKQNPRHPTARMERARAHLALAKPKEAQADLDAIMDLLDLGTLLEKGSLRGAVFLAQGDHARAAGEFERVLSLEPKHADALRHRARLRLAKKDMANAKADADALVDARPASASAYRLRAEILTASGDATKAAADLRSADRLEGKAP